MGGHGVGRTLPDFLAGKPMATGNLLSLTTHIPHPNRHLLPAGPVLHTGVTHPVPAVTEHLGTQMSST